MELSPMVSRRSFLDGAKLDISDERLRRLLSNVLSRIPEDTEPLSSVRRISMRKKGRLPGLAGLTRWTEGRQTITFYSSLLDSLSDGAYIAIIAHELAHAWLNEHLRPEESANREKEADELAARWGFGSELKQLTREADSIGGSVY
jgi:hypothetical protein